MSDSKPTPAASEAPEASESSANSHSHSVSVGAAEVSHTLSEAMAPALLSLPQEAGGDSSGARMPNHEVLDTASPVQAAAQDLTAEVPSVLGDPPRAESASDAPPDVADETAAPPADGAGRDPSGDPEALADGSPEPAGEGLDQDVLPVGLDPAKGGNAAALMPTDDVFAAINDIRQPTQDRAMLQDEKGPSGRALQERLQKARLKLTHDHLSITVETRGVQNTVDIKLAAPAVGLAEGQEAQATVLFWRLDHHCGLAPYTNIDWAKVKERERKAKGLIPRRNEADNRFRCSPMRVRNKETAFAFYPAANEVLVQNSDDFDLFLANCPEESSFPSPPDGEEGTDLNKEAFLAGLNHSRVFLKHPNPTPGFEAISFSHGEARGGDLNEFAIYTDDRLTGLELNIDPKQVRVIDAAVSRMSKNTKLIRHEGYLTITDGRLKCTFVEYTTRAPRFRADELKMAAGGYKVDKADLQTASLVTSLMLTRDLEMIFNLPQAPGQCGVIGVVQGIYGCWLQPCQPCGANADAAVVMASNFKTKSLMKTALHSLGSRLEFYPTGSATIVRSYTEHGVLFHLHAHDTEWTPTPPERIKIGPEHVRLNSAGRALKTGGGEGDVTGIETDTTEPSDHTAATVTCAAEASAEAAQDVDQRETDERYPAPVEGPGAQGGDLGGEVGAQDEAREPPGTGS